MPLSIFTDNSEIQFLNAISPLNIAYIPVHLSNLSFLLEHSETVLVVTDVKCVCLSTLTLPLVRVAVKYYNTS